MITPLRPTTAKERHVVLDALRGLALSNYLSQSLIGVLLFYGLWLFGLDLKD